MMTDFPILSFTIFLPVITAAILLLLNDKRLIKQIALSSCLGCFAACLFMLFNVGQGFSFVEKVCLVKAIGLDFFIGVDGLSILLINLTAFLCLLCILYLDLEKTERFKQLVFLLLSLQSLVMASFAALNLLLFYIFFELALVPMYFIIGIWGGQRRIYASYKFFIYTLFGSLLFLISLVFLFTSTATLSIPQLYGKTLLINYATQKLLWWAIFIAFAIKVPMLPLHTWLADAHVEAPTIGSVILAGILLKLGGYGFLRVLLPMFPKASLEFAQYPVYLSSAAIIYASLVAFAQKDLKKMIAYSSIAHMGYVTGGIFSFNNPCLQGAVFQMLSHGIISAALFFSVGIIYEKTHTKQIDALGGLADKLGFFACLFMIFTLGAIGLPGTSGFVGELFCLGGIFYRYPYIAACCAFGVLLGAVYMLSMYRRVFFGVPTVDTQMTDLSAEQKLVLLVLAGCILLFGLCPNLVLPLIKSYAAELKNIFTYYASY